MLYNVKVVKGFSIDVEADSPNNAIHEFAFKCESRTLNEPDVIWCQETNTGTWEDTKDDAEYIVSLIQGIG